MRHAASAPAALRGTLLVLIAIVLLPLVGFGVYEVVDAYRAERDAEARASGELARATAGAFEGFVQDIARAEQALAIGAAGPGHTTRQIHDELVRVLAEFPAVRDMSWLDGRGRVLTSTEPELVGKSFFARDYFQEISHGAEWRVSPLVRSVLDERPLFVVARGFRRPTGELAGIVTAAVDPDRLGSLLGRRFGGGSVSICDSAGTLVAMQPRRPLPWDLRGRTRDHPWVRRALGGEEALGIFRSALTGERRVGAIVPIRSIGWVAHASRPLGEAMAKVRRQALTNAAVLGAVAMGALGAALVLANRVSRRASQSEKRFRELQEERETLMQTVSHDLRTPLHVIVGHARILLRRGDEEARRRSEAILASAGRMTRLIGDLVDAARLEAGHVDLRLEPVDLRAFLRGWKDRMAGALATDRIRLVVPEAAPPVLADPGRLDQILANLISNALKYSVPDSEVRVELSTTASALRLSVADCGPGIAPEELPRLFERYFRAQTAARAEGLGLGLFITRKLVDAHGWRIEVESELGTGSIFTVVVPAPGAWIARSTAQRDSLPRRRVP